MEDAAILSLIISIPLLILQIILQVKVWVMTDDVKKIAQTVCRKSGTSAITYTHGGSAPATMAQANDPHMSVNFPFAPKVAGEVNDLEIGNTIVVLFEDGLVGRLKTYQGYQQYSVITKDGFELLYSNKNAALKALAEYLRQGTESQDSLLHKWCTPGSRALAKKYWR